MYCSIRDINKVNILTDEYVKEVILDGRDYSIIDVLDLTKKYDRVVYDLSGINELGKNSVSEFKTLVETRDNVVFRVSSLEILRGLLEANLPVFLAPSNSTVADSLERLYVLCKTGVTDVYIGGELGFKMALVRKIADKFGVNIRVIPNMTSISGFTGWFKREERLTDFWIRPEDLELYEPYVDCVEFFGDDGRQSVLYDIYFISKSWIGDLAQVISSLESIDNRGLVPKFTEARLNCGKKCIQEQCHSCYKYLALAELVVENKFSLELESI